MKSNIKVLAAPIPSDETSSKGTKYKAITLTYKDDRGTQAKKFNQYQPLYKTLEKLEAGKDYIATIEKSEKGFWEWTAIEPAGGGSATPTPQSANRPSAAAATATPAKGNWETPEERAIKQRYIVRQSGLSTAVATLTPGAKAPIDPFKVIELAKQFEAFVFGDGDVATSKIGEVIPATPVKDEDDFGQDDIPF